MTCQRACCPKCGISTRALLPTGNFGPRLQAMVSVCSGKYRMSKRQIEELIENFFGVAISLGSIANLEQATSDAVAAPVDDGRAHHPRAARGAR